MPVAKNTWNKKHDDFVSNVLGIMWKKKEEKRQYSQYPDQDSNRGILKMQRRNAAVAIKCSVPNGLRNPSMRCGTTAGDSVVKQTSSSSLDFH